MLGAVPPAWEVFFIAVAIRSLEVDKIAVLISAALVAADHCIVADVSTVDFSSRQLQLACLLEASPERPEIAFIVGKNSKRSVSLCREVGADIGRVLGEQLLGSAPIVEVPEHADVVGAAQSEASLHIYIEILDSALMGL